jgi:hypothetical protein
MQQLLAQAEPVTGGGGAGGGGGDGITINFPTIDWQTLVPQLVNYFFDGIGKFLNDALHTTFDGLWSSGANVVGQTDLAVTWGFGPVHDQVVALQGAARAILVFALILLGLRGMLASIVPKQPDVLAEFINGVVSATILIAAFPLLIPQVIDLTNQAATAIGKADLSRYVSSGQVSNPLIEGVLFIILLFFALRLLMKAVWRIGFLAVMLPVGMLACALYAVPQTRWILGWWARLWGGMLLAQIPSVMALTIGAQLFARGSGIGAFVYSIAFLQLATDLYSLIPFGSAGYATPPFGGVSWSAPAMLGGITRTIGGAAAAGGAAAGAGASVAVGQSYGYR